MRTILYAILIVMLPALAIAQKQNNNWCFGVGAGLAFDSPIPTPFRSNIKTYEAAATMSNRHTGALMFYTNGQDVRDRNNNIMPNGKGIGFDGGILISGSSAQGAVVVPFVNDTNKFYIFTIASRENALEDGRLAYSVVDMQLNNGLGDIVAGQKKIYLDYNYTEGMTVVPKCNGYWLMVVKRRSITYHAYEITAAGINTNPVSSQVSYQYGPVLTSTIKVSPDRKKLAIASFSNHVTNGTSTLSYLALHDFDVATGKIISGDLIDTIDNMGKFYGCEFSPSSKFLYATVIQFGKTSSIMQYDLSYNTPQLIHANKDTVAFTTLPYYGIQLGPDSTIYVAKDRSVTLGRFLQPDRAFPLCGYVEGSVLFDSTRVLLGLPQRIEYYIDPKPTPSVIDTSVCLEYPVIWQGRANVDNYYWQDGSTQDTFRVVNEGVYWVRSLDDACILHTDTFVVSNKVDTTHSRIDTAICFDGDITLTAANQSPAATYLWSNQDTAQQITVGQQGLVVVNITEPCRVATDSFAIGIKGIPAVLRDDTTICLGDTLLLFNKDQPVGADYAWSTGSTDSVIKVSAAGTYTLNINYQECKATDEMTITQYTPLQIDLGADVELCKGDELTLRNLARYVSDTKYLWQGGSTDEQYTVTQQGQYFLTITNICDTLTDSVYVKARNCHFFFPSAFTPNGDGRNDIAKMVGDIAVVTDYYLRIINRWGEVVFQTKDPTMGWDGSYKGQKAEVGTYFYQIQYTYDGKKELMKGDILLMR